MSSMDVDLNVGKTPGVIEGLSSLSKCARARHRSLGVGEGTVIVRCRIFGRLSFWPIGILAKVVPAQVVEYSGKIGKVVTE